MTIPNKKFIKINGGIAFSTRKSMMESAEAVFDFIKNAPAGSRIRYHLGFLALDIHEEVGGVALLHLKADVLEAERLGRVSLVQRKLAPYMYEYIAVVRPMPEAVKKYRNKAKLVTMSV